MNRITDDQFFYGMALADEGYSVREIARIMHIAKETAHRIQKNARLVQFIVHGCYKVLTGGGRNDCRRFDAKEIREPTMSLFRRQHYIKTVDDFETLAKEIVGLSVAKLRCSAVRRIACSV